MRRIRATLVRHLRHGSRAPVRLRRSAGSLGARPAFLARRGEVLAFSSLLRPLVEAGIVAPEIDPAALRQFLHFNYVFGPRTIFAGARLLPAGTWLEYHGGQVRSGSYWDLKAALPA